MPAIERMTNPPLFTLLFACTLLGAGACKHLGSLGLGKRPAPAAAAPVAAGFDAVEIEGDVTASIAVGGAFAVAIAGDEAAARQVGSRVENQTLVITAPRPGATVTIALPSLQRLQVRGARVEVTGATAPKLTVAARGGSTVKLGGLHGDRLVLEAAEGSRIVLAGTARSLDFALSGNSSGDARALDLRTARVRLAGGCRLDLRPTQAVTGVASGSSKLAVWSTPKRVKVATRGDSVVNYVR
jgi:hypothetical protein